MRDIKDQGQAITTSMSIRRGDLFRLDEVTSLVKQRTRFSAARSKLIAAAANLFYEVKDELDYDQIYDEATLQRELAQAIAKRITREQKQESEKD